MTFLSIAAVLLLIKAILTLALSLWHVRIHRHRFEAVENPPPPLGVSVMIAAYNEEVGIADTLRSVLAQGGELQIVVVDDGSRDRTAEIVAEFAARDPRVMLIRKVNGGKASALNAALPHLKYPVAVSVDADSALAPGALQTLAHHFHDPRIGAVAGEVRVAGAPTLLTAMQSLEYVIGQQLEKRSQDVLGIITVVPGAAGAFRTEVLRQVDGYCSDTLTEDMDLTVEIAAAGYRVIYEPNAISYTEPPSSLRDLWKQRLRWMYGTFQVLYKHRRQVLSPRGLELGWIAIPYIVIYGLLLGGLGPLFDVFWLTFLLIFAHADPSRAWGTVTLALGADLLMAFIALRMAGLSLRSAAGVPLQRAFLRPFVALVLLSTVWRFVSRQDVGWNKLARTGLKLSGEQAQQIPVATPAVAEAVPQEAVSQVSVTVPLPAQTSTPVSVSAPVAS